MLPAGHFRRIVIKPNWVHHEVSPDFPIAALVTSPALVDSVIRACIKRYPGAEQILVGDVPLQSCDFELMMRQSGTDRVAEKWSGQVSPRIVFRDLRRERFRLRDGFMQADPPGQYGDTAGYHIVEMDAGSLLDPVSSRRESFRVSDYDIRRIQSAHRQGFHRYLIAGSVLECDLFINLPKMKTHQKAGITGALKNLVGCNGEKAYLVHYMKGRPQDGGDEFPSGTRWPVRLQVRLREALQKRSHRLFALLRPGWRLLKRLYGIQTEGTQENLAKGRFYLAAGAWHGNDTIWRMVYDLNRMIRFARAGGGPLAETAQRSYIAIMDGMIAGEGNGPLQPLPVNAGLLLASSNPFVIDAVMARLMGFEPEKIPSLHHIRDFPGSEWSNISFQSLMIEYGDKRIEGIDALNPLRLFEAPPGWKGHIETERP